MRECASRKRFKSFPQNISLSTLGQPWRHSAVLCEPSSAGSHVKTPDLPPQSLPGSRGGAITP